MRALIVSDIHSNLEAFRAVLEDATDPGGFDELWCLGDTVGYGPDPKGCIELLRRHNYVGVVGNHDLAAVGELNPDDFNPSARAAAIWTSSQLTQEHVRFLSSLPRVVKRGDFTLVHGTLRSPVFEYLLSKEEAVSTFQLLETPCCLVGHSHIPFICREEGSGCSFERFPEEKPLPMGNGPLIVNPGSVGQPRDGDHRPSYALYASDEGTLERRRVVYEIGATQEKMRRAGLPDRLIERLDHGV